MKKNTKAKRSIKESLEKRDKLAETIAERTQMSLELSQQIALGVAANEKAQRRFRTVMLMRISRIETWAKMIHGAQLVQERNRLDAEQIGKCAEETEDFISRTSDKLGLAMVKFIYEESGEPGARRVRKRRWSDWEI